MSKPYELLEGIITNYELPRDDAMVKELSDLLQAQGSNKDKPEVTESGLIILEYMQNTDSANFKAKDIADGMGLSSRKVSGSLRKLVTDVFEEKFGSNPVIYSLTEKGKEFNIEVYKENFKNEEEE